jgi:two-component system sensor histidine kinase CpxA
MSRLFWKFFLSFWITLVLFSGATLWATSRYLDQFHEQENSTKPFDWLTRYVSEAQAAADSGGIEGLRNWAESIDRQDAVPILVLDAHGTDLLGHAVSQRILSHLVRHIKRAHNAENNSELGPSRVVRLKDNSEYWLMPDFQNVTLARIIGRPRVLALPLFMAGILSGLMCFLLARYLTAPIGHLRRATGTYAEGNLNYRVTPMMGKRRDEIVDLAHAFDDMAQRLNVLILSHKQLLRDVSHELRSPLARLQVALGLARRRASPEVEFELNRIEREAERLNDLIGQLLDLARLESGSQAPEMQPVDLQEVVETVVSDATLEARNRPCRVVLEENEPVVIKGNAALLHSAMENVVRNAIKYTAPETDITLSSRRDPDYPEQWMIEITDQGPGVPEEFLPRLFEPFVRVADARDRTSGGYGLGLSIAQRAIWVHAGKISATNKPNGGLATIINLPIANQVC